MSTRIRLGHKQELRINGVAMEGVRELDVSFTTKQVDVTSWNHQFASTLPLAVDVQLTVTLYYADEMNAIWQNILSSQKTPMELQVTGLITAKFVVSDVRIGCPMGGVVPHDVTFRLYSYA